MTDGFRKLTAKMLLNDIGNVVCFDEPEEYLEKTIDKYLLMRLSVFHCEKKTLYYIFEEEYIETEWKDMISIHYINTSYKTHRTVMRVHLFCRDELEEESYLGFFTLRNINDIDIMLSYIYPNWKNLKLSSTVGCYYMTYKKKVHIRGRELNIYTYPLFVQDSAVTSCSQASIISVSNYLKGKYNLPRIRILDINESYTYGRLKAFPTAGLDPVQMLQIFDYHEIPVDYGMYEDGAEEKIRAYIDFCVESAMPVLMGIHVAECQGGVIQYGAHVLQVIGHTLDQNGEKEYIIYDDSGYYLAERNRQEHGTASFVEIISWEEIKELLAQTREGDCGFVMYPLQEKVYILYDDIADWHFDVVEESIARWKDSIRKRIFVIDNVLLKKYLSDLLIDERDQDMQCYRPKSEMDAEYNQQVEKEVRRILQKNLPHYLWMIEISRDNGNKYLYIIDPTLNVITRKSILLSTQAIPTNLSVALLNDFGS